MQVSVLAGPMRPRGKIGALCLLISCTWLQAQQAPSSVLSADASLESSSNPHPFTESATYIHHQGLLVPSAVQHVSVGNPWMHSAVLGDPTIASAEDCVQLA